MKTVKAIIRHWLKTNGYDGLYHENDCGCEIDDLAPCGEDWSDCTPGVRGPCDEDTCVAGGGCPWHIGHKEAEGSEG